MQAIGIALYLAFVAAAYLVVRTYVWQTDSSSRLAPLPPPPDRLEPLELVLLRGGRSGVLRTTLRAMDERGLLQGVDGVYRHGPLSDEQPQDLLEAAIFDVCATPKTSAEIADSVDAVLTTLLGRFERKLRSEQLVMPPELKPRARALAIVLAFFLVLAGIALAQLAAADQPDAPPIFFLMGIFGLASLVWAQRVPRLSDRGQRYLAAVRAGARRPLQAPAASSAPSPIG